MGKAEPKTSTDRAEIAQAASDITRIARRLKADGTPEFEPSAVEDALALFLIAMIDEDNVMNLGAGAQECLATFFTKHQIPETASPEEITRVIQNVLESRSIDSKLLDEIANVLRLSTEALVRRVDQQRLTRANQARKLLGVQAANMREPTPDDSKETLSVESLGIPKRL